MRGRGKILVKILEILEEGVNSQADFFGAVLSSGYGASMGKLDYEIEKRRTVREKEKEHRKEIAEKRKRLQKFLSKLKQDGLIKEVGTSDKKFVISSKGKDKLKELKKKLPDNDYTLEIQERATIVSFDIPERMRGKRDWVREVLKNLDFEMVHQSVWVGKVKIPKQFIIDLEEIDILKYIEIFEISKTGSLNKVGKPQR